MPWKELSPKMQKIEFLAAWRGNLESKAELCRRFGVSRKTGYKLWRRWREEEEEALCPRSRAPLRCPHAMEEQVRLAIIELRRSHPSWGPKKLRACLERKDPQGRWPALSTIGDLLDREGLVEESRRLRRRHAQPGEPCTLPRAPGELWSADFKGWFLTQNGTRCDPLTVTDSFSRCLLVLRAMTPPIATKDVIAHFTGAFREHGLPLALRTDNGPPFATTGLGVTHFSAWLISLGISPRRIPPGKPQKNGQHEYMHRVLKAETLRPRPAASLEGQQARFDAFLGYYNLERPHEGIGLVTPGSLHARSERGFPEKIGAPEYPEGALVRRVHPAGTIKWRGRNHFLSSALAGRDVRLVEHGEEPVLGIIYYTELLGRLDVRSGAILPPDAGALPRTPEFCAWGPTQERKSGEGEPP